mmetsp:Transcript_66107/g.144397  ORF Transcript_66107/g.144397 Transcript_66107/m.144397 type:complete len:164 (-) Transcript_66107:71-562(-)
MAKRRQQRHPIAAEIHEVSGRRSIAGSFQSHPASHEPRRRRSQRGTEASHRLVQRQTAPHTTPTRARVDRGLCRAGRRCASVPVHRQAGCRHLPQQGAWRYTVENSAPWQVKKMVFDLGFVVEGHDDSELPEQLLGCCRLSKLDLDGAKDFPIALEEDDSDGN